MEIIAHELEADRLQREGDAHRWEAARLIVEELDAGKTQRALAAEIGKSATHVNHMAQTWRVCLGKHERPPWNEAYHSPEIRRSEKMPKTEPLTSAPPAPADAEPPFQKRQPRQSPGTGQSREALVRKTVQSHLNKTGRLPSARGVARELGDKDDRAVRAAWDALAEKSKLPRRPGPVAKSGAAGQLLDDAIETLRGFVERVYASSPEERESGKPYWLDRLGTIDALTDEAVRAIDGSALDAFLEEIQKES